MHTRVVREEKSACGKGSQLSIPPTNADTQNDAQTQTQAQAHRMYAHAGMCDLCCVDDGPACAGLTGNLHKRVRFA